eukprot:1150346-Pelagomonas_calceolata.AAC.1
MGILWDVSHPTTYAFHPPLSSPSSGPHPRFSIGVCSVFDDFDLLFECDSFHAPEGIAGFGCVIVSEVLMRATISIAIRRVGYRRVRRAPGWMADNPPDPH